jgi:hypothetical protein
MKWMQKATEKMEKKGTKGSLTKAAHRAGFSPMEYAHHLKASPNASTKMKRKAQFALNANQK